jgi:magnesium transporter
MDCAGPSTDELRALDPRAAAVRLGDVADADVACALQTLGPGHAVAILSRFDPGRRARIAGHAGARGELWLAERHWPEGSVGRLMEPVPGVFDAACTVGEVIATLRPIIASTAISYLYAVDGARHLEGVVAFRELAFADPARRLHEIMVPRPFALRPGVRVIDAMREVVHHHFPVYPVCDEDGCLLGAVRGADLFEQQAFEISAQAGAMVGVEKEERLATSWQRSLRLRHPWLLLNLVTAFVAAAVVGLFQGTINRIVLLAVFLPVLSGQCSNTGCQALAVTLRGMTLGELRARHVSTLLWKETWLGLVNGALTGVLAGIGMYIMACFQHEPHAWWLATVTFIAMIGSCALSGFAGAAVPLALRRLGTDPATASSIFLTTATDVVSMGIFLGLAAWLVAG